MKFIKFDNYKISYKRLIITCVIIVLVAVILGLSATCVVFYHDLHRLDRIYEDPVVKNDDETETEEDTVTALEKLEEIVKYYNNYYVNDVDNETLKEALIETFFEEIGDRYGAYYTEEEYAEISKQYAGEGKGVGIEFSAKDEGAYIIRTMKNSPADLAGLLSGDIITKLGDISLAGLTADEIKADFLNYDNDCPLTVKRGDEILNITVTKSDYEYDTVYCDMVEYEEKKIAVISITHFYENTTEDLKETVQEAVDNGAEGIVFDLRGNPGGLLSSVVNMLDYLLPEGPIAHINYKNSENSTEYTSDSDYATDLPMAVLVNGNTASAAELFTSSLKDYKRATVVGTTTYGKGCGQQTFQLSDKSMVKLTTFYYTSAYSENYDGVGIEPDIIVELDPGVTSISSSDINADNQLKTAVAAVADADNYSNTYAEAE